MQAVSMTASGKSLAALERAVEVYERHQASDLLVTVRNSLILEFEICYRQVRPLLERALVDISEESPATLQR